MKRLLAIPVLLVVLAAGVLVATAMSRTTVRQTASSTSPDTILGSTTPAVSAAADANAVALGVKFSSTASGSVTGVRFFKGKGNTGTHIGALYSSAGKVLASASFTGETSSGWQSVTFSAPVSITAGTTYVAAYLAPKGDYPYTTGGFSKALTSGPLSVPANGGVYVYGSKLTFPSSTYQADDYFVDVSFVPTPVPVTTTQTTPPVTTATTPSTTTSAPPTTTTAPSTTMTTASPVTTTTGTTTTPPVIATDCFASPGACGYPDPAYGNVGATGLCSSLTPSGSVTANTTGETITNLNITGDLTVTAPNVTVSNVCVNEPGNGTGVLAVEVGQNAKGLALDDVTIQAAGSNAFDTGVWNVYGVAVKAERVIITGAAESWHGPGDVEDSYLQAGAFYDDAQGPSHNEDVYLADSSWTGIHDTLLNSSSQTAIFFGDTGSSADNSWTVENSLLAGGGYATYWNAKASTGPGVITIENNRWARCLGATSFSGWGTTCTDTALNIDGGQGTTGDGNGYYPYIGYYGGPIDGNCSAPNVWVGNVYDDNNQTVPCD